MNNTIQTLAADLKPVKNPLHPGILFVIWSAAALLFLLGAYAFTGWFRPNVITELATSPRYLLQTIVGFTLVFSASFLAFQWARPTDGDNTISFWSVVLLLLFYNLIVISEILYPSLPLSEAGYRPFCAIEVLLFSLAPLALMIKFLKFWAPTQLWKTTLVASIGSVGFSMMMMQLACKYDPVHVLVGHLLPFTIVIIVAPKFSRAILGWRK